MITSVFKKSKPINLVIIVIFVVLLFVITNHTPLFSNFNSASKAIFKLGIVLFMVFLLDFIISKNNLTQRNSYSIMAFGLLFAVFPNALNHSDILMSNLFIMFALRRIISLHSHINVKKKFFDAAFWIAFATLFYFWAMLFFALVIVALIYHSQNDVKNTIIPFVAIAAVGVLLMSFNIIFYDEFIQSSNFELLASLDFTAYNSAENIIKLTILFTMLVWIMVYYFKTMGDKNKKLRPSYFIIGWAAVIAVLVAIIAPLKNGSEFLFLFAPFSIILTKYIEIISERWFKEVFVTLLIVAAALSLLL
ncbi:DUF6427 family protein [Winogradskyella ursingii]|uniref:DUF6427 family protein n=1 Tax=Winogradskyella ursingii TaxID=2686079 RepID=UPI0015CC238A|nr:DUF6427 family protein [Winogradskyella ursingii]